MSMSETTVIHEVTHAVVCMALGHAPERLVVNDGGGMVSLPDAMNEEAAAIVGLSGGIGVQQILDETADASASVSDCELLAKLYSYGNRHDIDRHVYGTASSIVAQHTDGIVAMANAIMRMGDSVDLSRNEIGDIVRRTPSLQQFAGLFPRTYQPPSARASRRQRTLPSGFSFTVR